MPTATLTQPGTQKLSEVARRVHAPAGIVSTGWPAVEAKCADIGISFRWWQVHIGRLILAKRADGTYASTVGGTGLSIPRQVGKTFLVAAVMFALCLLRPGYTVLWTAHRLKTADETFGKLQVFAKRRKIAPHVQQVYTGSGEQRIVFRNGSRILFGARERGFGRGFDEVDALVFDEAQHMTDSSLDDMVPATNQSRQPEGALMLFMGTPPRPQDPGEVFARMRADAKAGDEDTGWVEFGAEPNYSPTPLPAPLDDADWGQIAAANPSFPEDTSRTAVLRLRKKLGDDSFLREGLGIWTERLTGMERFAATWLSLIGPTPPQGPDVVFALDVAPDHSNASIAAAWTTPDGAWLQLADHRPGVDWIVARAGELLQKWGGRIVVEQTGTAAFLLPRLTGADPVSRRFYADACSTLDAAVTSRSLRHGNQRELNDATTAARWTSSGEAGQRVLSRKDPQASPLVAAALALHGLNSKTTSGGWAMSL